MKKKTKRLVTFYGNLIFSKAFGTTGDDNMYLRIHIFAGYFSRIIHTTKSFKKADGTYDYNAIRDFILGVDDFSGSSHLFVQPVKYNSFSGYYSS